MSRCANCPCSKYKVVESESRPGASIAIVGEGPGYSEVEQGRPFVGPSGKELFRQLHTIGIRRSDCHITNATLCAAPKSHLKGAVAACMPRLQRELAELKPRIIIALGAAALQSVMRKKTAVKVLKFRGSVSPITFEPAGVKIATSPQPSAGSFLLPLLHPAFVLRSPAWRSIWEKDWQRVRRVIDDGWAPPELDPGRQTWVARTRGELTFGLGKLGNSSREVSLDIETVGLGPTRTALVCFGISDGDTTLIVPWSKGRDGSELWWREPHAVAAEVNEFLASHVAVGHNLNAFDLIVLRRYGIEAPQWEDTLIATHATASHLPKNLFHVASQYLDVGPWKEQEDRTATIERLWNYNARDCLYTILAWQAKRAEVAA